MNRDKALFDDSAKAADNQPSYPPEETLTEQKGWKQVVAEALTSGLYVGRGSKRRASSPAGAIFFYSVFLIAGLAMAVCVMASALPNLTPFLRYVEGQCTITSAQVESRPGEDGMVFGPQFTYILHTPGGDYEGHLYRLSQISTESKAPAEAIIANYEVGRDCPCWYNPADPRQVILDRSLDSGLLLFLVAFTVGAVMLLAAPGLAVRRIILAIRETRSTYSPHFDPDAPPGLSTGIRLKGRDMPAGDARMAGFVLLFTSLVFSLFGLAFWTVKAPALCWGGMILFMLPFWGLALSELKSFARYWRYGHKTSIYLGAEPLRPGQKVQLHIEHQTRRPLEVESAQIKLIGRKELDTTRNKAQRRQVFYEQMLAEQYNFTIKAGQPWRRTLEMTLPHGAQPSGEDPDRRKRTVWGVMVSIQPQGSSRFEPIFPFRVIGRT